ncbi:glycosyltransferase [Christiangramia sediminicola]|uniref:Glycosyltransferase n=1 Tax=Christiangramia sediminicola TaxID=3073267 RepID=A0ABU1EQA8_9FLAO|nr:glycosyltransferase [Christiangramia sp. SM2212]MDR5590576.1 glycosyltransferase [Christiangramia sp. SM2212]
MDSLEFRTKYELEKVVESDSYISNNCLVSVCVQTYQHVDFITDCIESILKQKTKFDFEILIGDDDSTDGTRQICEKYSKLYPNKIRLFYHHRKNNIQIKGQPTGRFVMMTNFYNANSKYIALCEGDDYWIDEFKLQKQIDLLENKEIYVASFTNAIIIDKGKKVNTYNNRKKETYSTFDVIEQGGGFYPTASLVFRNKIRDWPNFMFNYRSGDRILSLLLSLYGEFYYHDEITCAYRLHDQGVFNSIKENANVRQKINYENIQLLKDFDDFSKKKYHRAIKKNTSRLAKVGLLKNNKIVLDKPTRMALRELNFLDWLSFLKTYLLKNVA